MVVLAVFSAGGILVLALKAYDFYATTIKPYDALSRSAPFREAVRRANCSKEVGDAIGTPAHATLLDTGGTLDVTDDGDETATLSIAMSGKSADGTLEVEARTVEDLWVYTDITLRPFAKEGHDAPAPIALLGLDFADGGCPAPPRPAARDRKAGRESHGHDGDDAEADDEGKGKGKGE